jgi:hypothetical protein
MKTALETGRFYLYSNLLLVGRHNNRNSNLETGQFFYIAICCWSGDQYLHRGLFSSAEQLSMGRFLLANIKH